MGEIDYQLALLLQHQFEQELRAPKEYKADIELARTLQEEFQRENDVEKPVVGLVYDSKRSKTVHNSSKSLTDPSWEVIDPTPDIHMLFIAFNERFFWNKLLAVCVSWSKRMTTCAGVCSYQGRGGMCSITLSEPLLKLRPRKDLVETLLHEMIHAFLFVTHNNRDRDGHGPEFHKHMYRINGEAGTNITVYHDFHDEVRLYQQHWWRCDGPCQKRKPYFGMVRRAMNRAPGPQDRWWDEHLRNCGGNFIKVKEPEKPEKKSSKASKENKKPKEDIRNFIPPLNKSGTSKNLPNSSQSIASGNIKTTAVLGDIKSQSNVHTVSNATNNDSKISAVIQSKVSNIYGFTNLSGTSSNNLPKQVPSSSNKGNTKGIGKNTSTIVTTKKPTNTATKSESDKLVKPISSTVTNGVGRTLSESTDGSKNLDYSVVRNHWLNKYSNTNTNPTGTKRGLPPGVPSSTGKVPKLLSNPCSSSVTLKADELGECPVCVQKISIVDLNAHIDKCLETPLDDHMKECIICNVKVHISEYEKHVSKCTEKNFSDDVFEVPQVNSSKKCSACGSNISLQRYSAHIASCSTNGSEEKQCNVCEKMVLVTIYDSHVEKCLLKMYDDMEANYGKEEEKVECLACGKSILKSDLGEHLDDCMNMSRVFEDDNEPKEEEASTSREDNREHRYNCPFCMKLVPEVEMSTHIDECLNIVDCFPRVQKEKSIMMESFSSSFFNEDF